MNKEWSSINPVLNLSHNCNRSPLWSISDATPPRRLHVAEEFERVRGCKDFPASRQLPTLAMQLGIGIITIIYYYIIK